MERMNLDDKGISRLRAELVLDGLPEEYVDRLARELEDHLEDLATESRRTLGDELDSRLGCANELREGALQEYRKRSFPGRHPAICFAILPPLLAFLAIATFNIIGFTVSVLLLPTLRENWDWAVGHDFVQVALQSQSLWLVYLLGHWVPLLLVAYWVIELSLASGVGRRWRMRAIYALTLIGTWDLFAYWMTSGTPISGSVFDLRMLLPSNFALFISCLLPALSPWMAWFLVQLRHGRMSNSRERWCL